MRARRLCCSDGTVDRARKWRLGSENGSGGVLWGCRCSPFIVRRWDEWSGCLQGLAVSASLRWQFHNGERKWAAWRGNEEVGEVIGRRRFASGEKVWRSEVRKSGGASTGGGWWHSASRGRGRWPAGWVGWLIGWKAKPLGRLRRKIKGKKWFRATKRSWAEMTNWIGKPGKLVSLNLVHGFGFKIKDSNNCELNLNWSQIEINSNKLFEDFSNLGLVKN
jgi:hypothetical protein